VQQVNKFYNEHGKKIHQLYKLHFDLLMSSILLFWYIIHLLPMGKVKEAATSAKILGREQMIRFKAHLKSNGVHSGRSYLG